MSFSGFPSPPGTGSPPPPLNHNLLSSTHADTVAASPLLGDIITSPSSGVWERLAVGLETEHLVIVAGIPTWLAQTGSGLGDVTGPTGADDNYIATYNGNSGKIIQQGLVTIDDNGNLTSEGNILVSGDFSVLGNTTLEDLTVNNNLTVGGNTLISGDITVLGNVINSGLVINTVSSGTPVTTIITNTYYNAITSATTGVVLPASPVSGQELIIKDIDGVAGISPITVLGNGNTIDSLTSVPLVNNYEAMRLIFGPTEWNII